MALTDAQVQAHIDQALAAGYSQATIDSFLAANGQQDAGRLLSALAPNLGPGGGITPAVLSMTAFAIPTPLLSTVGSLTTPDVADGQITVAGSISSSPVPATPNPVAAAVPIPGVAPIPSFLLAIAAGLIAWLIVSHKESRA